MTTVNSGVTNTKVADWMEKVDRLLLQQDKRLRQLEQENRELKARNRDLEDRLLALENLRNPDAVAEKKAKVMLSYQAMKSRDLVTRSDDVQPLEPVVAQMSQRLTEVSAEVQALKNTNTHQDAAIQEAGSSVYVRWGRSVCPNSTHLVYSGVIGGSYYNHDGAASNVLCLTMSPVFSNHAIPGEHSMLYGGEYETWDSHYQKDPVCAVCRSQRPTTIMVPGTNVCMPGWTLEYSGFLMANHYTFKAVTLAASDRKLTRDDVTLARPSNMRLGAKQMMMMMINVVPTKAIFNHSSSEESSYAAFKCQQKDTHSSKKAHTHDMSVRSDDTTPLEPVVTQLSQRLTEVSADVQAMKTSNDAHFQSLRDANTHQDAAIQEAGSSVYVHWGRSVCPSSSHLVYSGVVGGSWYGHEDKDVVCAVCHDVSVRSDDTTPLEPVVTQLSQQLTEVSAEVQAMKNANTQQDAAIQEAGSSVYVRWGRSVCPSSSHLVYSGVVGGSWLGAAFTQTVDHASDTSLAGWMEKSSHATFEGEQKDKHSREKAQIHDVSVRSDDTTPLEPVVTQLSQRLTEVSAEVQAMKNTNTQQDAAIQEAGSSVYVRWGRSSSHAAFQGQQKDTYSSRKAHTHDVSVRSDDTTPLEPVVTQLSQRLTEVSAEVQAMKNSNDAHFQTLRDANTHQDAAIQEAGSSVYVRWGRSVCPNSTHLVYSGVIGGSYFNHEVTQAASDRKLTRHDVNANETSNATFEGQQKDTHSSKKAHTHDMAVRSDDTSPVGQVVTQLTQRLTEVSAEVQAMKNSNDAHFQTLQDTSAEVQALKNANTHQDAAIQEAGSSVYVRWGRSVCPNSTHLVYSGVVGGSYYNHEGGAANILCLFLSPVFSTLNIPYHHAWLYGAEYETSDSHHNKDVVCAVCRSQRPTTIMVPGTNVCMPGWTLEYSGFLMANDHVQGHHAGTEYICVDSAMDERIGSDADLDGLVLYVTVTHCGSLPCGPYADNKVVTCAVCSQ
nr:hypothetical protein BaRGS_018097 [Batillaria attramentaria]